MSDINTNYQKSRGALPWQPGDEPAEDAIGRVRDQLFTGADICSLRGRHEWHVIYGGAYCTQCGKQIYWKEPTGLLACSQGDLDGRSGEGE